MKILIATGIFPPDIGGPATYSELIAREFAARGHEIMVVTYGNEAAHMKYPVLGEKSETQDTKYKIRFISRRLPKGIRHIAYFWQVLKNGIHADILYAQDAVSAGFPAILAALLLRKRFFLKVVGDHAWEQGMQRFGVTDLLDEFLGKRYGFSVWLLRKIQTFTARRALGIVVPSEYLKTMVEQWGISAKKLVVIPNAVSLPDHVPLKEEARRTLGLEGFLLVTIGRLVSWKGFQMLVELVPKLVEEIPDAKLVIVGDGPERHNLESRIKNRELWNKVVLVGSIPKAHVITYLAAADVFLLNTGYEGFSHQLVEAMGVGVPIITTNAGGNKETVKDGENALLARYNDLEDWKEKIFQLHKNTDLRARLARPPHEITRLYSIETMITKTEFIIHNS